MTKNKRQQVRTHVWLHADELERLSVAAMKAELPLSSWIRSAVLSCLHDGLTIVRRPKCYRRSETGERLIEI